MIVSTKGRYALRFLIDIAENQGEGYVSLRSVANRQELSEKYMEIIARELLRNGLIVARRGKEGGYRLSRAPKEYGVKEIIEAMEGPLLTVTCLGDGQQCDRMAECRTLPLWRGMGEALSDYLQQYTLLDLVKRSDQS